MCPESSYPNLYNELLYKMGYYFLDIWYFPWFYKNVNSSGKYFQSSSSDLESVLNFMYHGEVNIAQEQLNSFLAVAEELRVKGEH